MGNTRSVRSRSHRSTTGTSRDEASKSFPASNGKESNGKPHQKKNTAADVETNFIVHGIDFLPDFEKKRELRKKNRNIPKFLKIDINWNAAYLNIFEHVKRGHGGRTPEKSDSGFASITTNPADGDRTPTAIETRSLARTSTQGSSFEGCDEEWKIFDDYPFENVVMSGGGSKGYAYIGALKALEDCGILSKVKHIGGSSAGAICAGLLAVGCTPQDIANVFRCDIKWLFHDQTCTCCCCIPRVCDKYGVHPARRFYEIYGQHIQRKVGNPDITFKELKDQYGRELCIVVTNLSRMCSEYCTPTTCPNLPIRDAVRMSMAFPVVFRAVRYNLTGRECLYTDGGMLDQYPIHCFDGPEYELNHNKQLTDDPDDCNLKTIGLYVVSEKPIDYKIWQTLFEKEIPYKPTYLPNTKLARARLKQELSIRKRQNKQFSKREFMDELRASVGNATIEMWDHYEVLNKSHVDINNFSDYFVAAIETLLISQRKMHVKKADAQRTVAVNCGYIGTSDYVIEPGDREFMINQGYACTRRFLQDFIAQSKVKASLELTTTADLTSLEMHLDPTSDLTRLAPDSVTTPESVDDAEVAIQSQTTGSRLTSSVTHLASGNAPPHGTPLHASAAVTSDPTSLHIHVKVTESANRKPTSLSARSTPNLVDSVFYVVHENSRRSSSLTETQV